MTKKIQSHAQIIEDLGDLLAEDIFEMSDDEVWEVAERAGQDPDVLVSRMRASARKLLVTGSTPTSEEVREQIAKLLSKKMKGYHRFRSVVRLSLPAVNRWPQTSAIKPTPCSLATVPQGTRVSGSIDANEGSLVIEGEVDGNVQGSTVTIGKTGVVKGNVVAGIAVVHGQVGNVSASQVLLAGDALVSGDITHTAICIGANVTLKGQCHHLKLGGPISLGRAPFAEHGALSKDSFFVSNVHRHKD